MTLESDGWISQASRGSQPWPFSPPSPPHPSLPLFRGWTPGGIWAREVHGKKGSRGGTLLRLQGNPGGAGHGKRADGCREPPAPTPPTQPLLASWPVPILSSRPLCGQERPEGVCCPAGPQEIGQAGEKHPRQSWGGAGPAALGNEPRHTPGPARPHHTCPEGRWAGGRGPSHRGPGWLSDGPAHISRK